MSSPEREDTPVEQAYARYVTRTAMHLGATDFEPVVDDFNIELGFLYRSPAIMSEGAALANALNALSLRS